MREIIQVRDKTAFNASELPQPLDFRDIDLSNLGEVPNKVRERLSGVTEQALRGSSPDSVLNVVLGGPYLASDVQAVLKANNEYNIDLFLCTII